MTAPTPPAARDAGVGELVSVDRAALEKLRGRLPGEDEGWGNLDMDDIVVDACALLATAAPLAPAAVDAGTLATADALIYAFREHVFFRGHKEACGGAPVDVSEDEARAYRALRDALATAAQPARAVPDRAAVEAALGTITDAARRAVRYYDDDDEQDAAFERIDIAIERVLALIYADATADASAEDKARAVGAAGGGR